MKSRLSILIVFVLTVIIVWVKPITSEAAAGGNDLETALSTKRPKQPRRDEEPIDQFINAICKEAQEIAAKNDLYASIMIAQAILESGSGTSLLSKAPYYNLFGMKGGYQGQSITLLTQEDDGSGQLYTVQSAFRVYPSYKEALWDYTFLLKHGLDNDPFFYKGTWKSQTADYREATRFLAGTYATDISYAQKLNELITLYELTCFDEV
ncbi:hypothetical protein GIX45_09305 [Erwinia sp. CPCC 100877]|nr:hypothetical protein [Erwinia sp. CPCC 100877]